MKLSTKLIVWLVPVLVLLYGVSQFWQQVRSHRLLQQAGQTTLAQLDALAVQNAENVQLCADAAIVESMKEGEMDEVTRAMARQQEVKGLLEFSLYNEEGIVTYASDTSFLKRALPPEVKTIVFGKPTKLIRPMPEATEVYQPLLATKACLECHTDWKPDSIIGGTLVRFSNQAIREAKSSWTSSLAGVERSNQVAGIATVAVLTALICVLSVLVTRQLVARPLTRISCLLEADCEQVHLASTQTASVSQAIADGASQQAASLEEASASLAEMSSMTRRSAESAETARSLTATACKAADQGQTDMAEMTSAMADIKSASDNIARIIKTIDEIAFQTNLLALNAAVEAARAGEAGMGFAVVADEVRNLARRSAEAAKETAARIEDCISRSERGVVISSRVAEGLQSIAAQAKQVDGLVNEIAGGLREQDLGISQLTQAVGQMDQVTQGNASRAEENAAAAHELRSQADTLHHAIDELSALVEGTGAASKSASVPAPTATRPLSRPTPSRFAPVPRFKPVGGRKASVPSPEFASAQ